MKLLIISTFLIKISQTQKLRVVNLLLSTHEIHNMTTKTGARIEPISKLYSKFHLES